MSNHGRDEEVEPPKNKEGRKDMKNRLADLNNHLFAQMERLGEETLKGDALVAEITRSKAISGIAKDIVANAQTVLEVQKLIWDRQIDREQVPGMLKDGPKQLKEN